MITIHNKVYFIRTRRIESEASQHKEIIVVWEGNANYSVLIIIHCLNTLTKLSHCTP